MDTNTERHHSQAHLCLSVKVAPRFVKLRTTSEVVKSCATIGFRKK